ncbi:MAG: DUF2239 family protein [Pseudomonadales bacterium]|nr:DUF2239 family protein [Pseudomonadales bacterium]
MSTEYIAIYEKKLISRGDLETIVAETKALGDAIEPYVFEFESCKRIDLNWHGDAQSVIESLPLPVASTPNKRGRPKLGVTAKEVTLLPKHWDWLASQRGGASVTLRRLVDHAMKNATVDERIQQKQNQLYGLITVFADETGFEEASRALYRNSRVNFEAAIATWPSEMKPLLLEKFERINQLHQGSIPSETH